MFAARRLLGIGAAGALVVALALGLAACGAGTGSGGGTSGPPIACGSVSQGATLEHPGDAHTAENCFWQAYQHCQPATLIFTAHGVDAGSTHTLTLAPQGSGCRITDVRENYVAGISHSTKTYTCSSLKQESPGLLLQGCGAEGDVQIAG
jgi:hypothetical protein